jgi:hypothetical protein
MTGDHAMATVKQQAKIQKATHPPLKLKSTFMFGNVTFIVGVNRL